MLCKITRPGGAFVEQSRTIKLPKSEADLNAAMMDVGIGRENYFVHYVSDVKTGNAALDEWFAEHESVTIDELNHIAEFTDKLSPEQIDDVAAIVAAEHPTNGVDFINILHNSDDFTIYEDIADMEELGKEAAFRFFEFDEDSPIGVYVDYKGFGESFHDAHGGTFSGGKYIIPPPDPKQAYDGVMIPGTEQYAPNTLASLFLISRDEMERLNTGEIDDPRGIWVRCPTTNFALDRAAIRLGEETADNCIIYTAKSPLLVFSEEPAMTPSESPYNINELVEALSAFKDPAMMEKYEAALEFECRGDAHYGEKYSDLIDLAQRLDDYYFNPEIRNVDDYAYEAYDNDLVKIARSEFSGEELMELSGGRIVENGYVSKAENELLLQQETPEQSQDQGMEMQ